MLDAYGPAMRCAYRSNKLPILIYHQVLPAPDPMRPFEITAAQFDQQLRWLSTHFNVLPLTEAVALLKQRRLPARSLVITFDDGYENNYSIALPLLLKHQLRATFFVATDFIDGGMMWNDQVIEGLRQHSAPQIDLQWLGLGVQPCATWKQRQQLVNRLLPRIKHLPTTERMDAIARLPHNNSEGPQLMMTTEQIKQLRRAGMEIGGHSCSHPILTRLPAAERRREIEHNKQQLEAILDQSIDSFAYPNGKPEQDYDQTCIEMVKKAGYIQAASTAPGINKPGGDSFQLQRYTPWRRNRLGFMAQLIRNRFCAPPLVARQSA